MPVIYLPGDYDAWKLRSPYDDYPDEPDCYHEHYDINVEGLAICDECGERWYADKSEIEHYRYLNANYDAWCHREERRQWWRDRWMRFWMFFSPMRLWLWETLHRLGWRRTANRCLSVHDEIPF